MTTTPPANESKPAAGIAAWRILFRMLAGFLALFSFAYWSAAGWNRGWTKTSVPVKKTDEVTGITVDDYQKRFVPGLDMLGAAVFGSALLAGLSFFWNKKKPETV